MTTKAKKLDPEISRRKFVTAAMAGATGIGLVSFATILGGLRPVPFITDAQKPVEIGDVLVYAEGPKAGQPVGPDDLEKDGPYITVYPKGNDVVRSEGQGATINAIMILKYALSDISAPAKPEATADGVIAFSKLCPHLGCSVLAKGPDGNLPCPCHGSKFDGKSGEVLVAPSPRGLPQLPIKLENNQFVVSGKWLETVYGTVEA